MLITFLATALRTDFASACLESEDTQPARSFKEINKMARWQLTALKFHWQQSLLTHTLSLFHL